MFVCLYIVQCNFILCIHWFISCINSCPVCRLMIQINQWVRLLEPIIFFFIHSIQAIPVVPSLSIYMKEVSPRIIAQFCSLDSSVLVYWFGALRRGGVSNSFSLQKPSSHVQITGRNSYIVGRRALSN